ncbi:tyrosine--tRNA ligase [Bacteroidetes bacterium endosymbiont of Geopemphigus sp.]|uniref:tyrosine--tRNA ligase n=1 Tax=Bacteroidetes bacterium endosymbiont of Geopemphigus sp. TaxID=2047937 RepID=UPI000CD0E28B|nr:tyrosine--tRNA ligase [Bacteroidetes bacterium endosymbiont of Geopemphigus sp.]
MEDLIKEFSWRGLLQEHTPGLQDQLKRDKITLYVGFDPTADSLHIGSLLPIIMLAHFERTGHKPMAIIGGATGMIGDPSGKSTERQLLDEFTLAHNISCIKSQLARFLNFEMGNTRLLNNHDWMREISFLEFAQDIGKHLTVNYMMSKDSVKKRLGDSSSKGMSFTEFTYQLLQAYDFLHLFQNENCLLQIGGSDQWGNITTGIELIRRKMGATAHGLTFPLITKADGAKFGKSESGENIWLEARRTSPYKFFQFWINTSDEEAGRFIKMYTFLPKDTINQLIEDHRKKPHKCILQQRLATELTRWVHGEEACKSALSASRLLFGNNPMTSMEVLDDETFLSVFEGVPRAQISIEDLQKGISIIDALVEKSGFLSSKAEARRALKERSILVNRQRIDEDLILGKTNIREKRYILLQRGKKSYFILEVVKT